MTCSFQQIPLNVCSSCLTRRCSVNSSDLKSLRLAAKQYADLPRLLEKLFHSIRLEASPKHVRFAETLDLQVIKPYVRSVTMAPSKYSWDMTEDIFQDIVLTTPLQKFCEKANKEMERNAGESFDWRNRLGRSQFAELGMKGFVQRYMDGKMPFSDADIRAGYEHYMQHAQHTRQLFETKQVHRAWTKVLMQLPDVHSFKIGIYDFKCTPRRPWPDLGCVVDLHEHHHGKGHNASVCRQLQEPVAEALFSAAIASLVAARSEIIQLDIECVVDGRFVWADNGELDGLDLSHLQTLSFQPVGADYRHQDPEATVTARYSLAITTLLHKCSPNLQKLDIRSHFASCPIPWPPPSTSDSTDLPLLPALLSFRTNLELRLPAFARFLHRAPILGYLQLDSCHGKLGEWRELWDAVRHHPNRMMLEFDQLPCHEATEVSLTHHTGEASKTEFEEDVWDNINWSLENYMSGLRHWDRSLRMWFDDGYDSEDDDDEDDDDEDNEDNEDDEDDEDEDTGDKNSDESDADE